MLPTSTAAPIAWAALYDFVVALAPAGVQVVEGPAGGLVALEMNTIVIGHSDGTAPAVVVTRADVPSDACGRFREQGDIVCLLRASSGDSVIAPLRTWCFDRLTELDDALKNKPGIDGAVDAAWLGVDSEWVPRRARDGTFVQVAFTVHYVAEL